MTILLLVFFSLSTGHKYTTQKSKWVEKNVLIAKKKKKNSNLLLSTVVTCSNCNICNLTKGHQVPKDEIMFTLDNYNCH